MARALLVLLLAAGLGAAAFLLLRDEAGPGGAGAGLARPDAATEEEQSLSAPGLAGSGRGPRARPGPAPDEPPSTGPAAAAGEVLAEVQVLDAATGQPLAGAQVWFEPAGSPCPRLPDEAQVSPPPSPLSSRAVIRHTTDAEGRFVLDTARHARPPAEALDVFAAAPGYRLGLACAVRLDGGRATLRLARGHALQGRVVDPGGRGLEGCVVLARPAAAAARLPENAGWAVSDEQGRFALSGLGDGPLRLTVAREGWFPQVLPEEDPRDPRERVVRLVPALALRFRLRTDDGRPPENPTVRAVLGQPAEQVLELLTLLPDETAEGRLTAPVLLPASAGTVELEVKADGYAPFRLAREPVPPEGGARTLPVLLARDSGQGALLLLFEDESGRALPYRDLRALPPTITPLDRQDLGGGVVLETAEALRFPSLPPGRYEVGVRAFGHAPALVTGSVVAGAPSEVRTRLRPAARLRVRFSAPSARLVRFRLLQDGRVVPALTEAGAAGEPEAGDAPLLAAGEGGVVLGGLASGTYVVEVLSDDLLPSQTTVRAREGETEEVEIRVQPR